MFRGPKVTSATVEHLPSVPAQVGAGAGIGVASAIFGIGGGSLTVPYLSRHGVVMQQAVERCRLEALPRIVWKNLKKLQEFGMLSLKVVTCSVTKNGN